jgi:hypothetical protein
MLHLHARLQVCEAGDPVVERDNLAIRHETSGFLLINRFNHLGIFCVQPNSIPRKEIQIATTAKSEAALPSHFGSNNHPWREKTSSVSVANMGATHFGCARFRSRALTSAGSPSSRLRPDMEFHLSTDAPRQANARTSMRVGRPPRSWPERSEAERVAWLAPGVTKVEDRIVVALPNPPRGRKTAQANFEQS